ncbi:C-terminal processing protease CtpA/Prc [Cellulophaga sp. RHA_52]|uniref:S41 family peptidase n=1 Tax=Cellulophaga sp. RHA_52 TaxID=1250036 RepID=UPI00119A8EBE|nr:S41 family peptidase [Cellulophaga sp. RHA_52]TVZ09443.1 C-terminal processing protease CtpA/Prc [Cellulophaga sp. RHA_52]
MKKTVILLSGLFLFLTSCDKNDDDGGGETPQAVTLNNEINEFIWKGLNHWYFWQEDVPNLADTKDDDQDSFYTYLNSIKITGDAKTTEEALFNSLIYKPDVVDDFSWFIEDVDEQLASFNGISTTYGITRGPLVRVGATDNVVQVIGSVAAGSPAEAAGLKRGDIISKVDGEVMTIDNYLIVNKLYTQESVTLGLATVSETDALTQTEEKSLTAATLSINPVHHTSVIEEGGRKIGYLVYEGFRGTYNGELNDAFGELKAAGVNELILDFRYNGGGSVLSSALLASMIYGEATAETNTVSGEVFAELKYNAKRDANNSSVYPFFEDVFLYDKTTGAYSGATDMNRLTGITRLYVLGTERTASASEMIINGLRPYINVKVIGEKTTGKNEGSITVVDAPGNSNTEPYTDLDNRSTKHTVGMQPIVFQIYNANNESDYTNGFVPDVEVKEYEYYKNIKPFGDTNEVLLRAALDDMLGTAGKFDLQKDANATNVTEGVKFPKFSSEMYIMPNDIKPTSK